MPLAPHTRVGPYEVKALLGAGGMGEVYRARDPRLGRDVAIKVLHPRTEGSGGGVARFAQEARAASALNHPSIVTVYDVGELDGNPWIAMELVDGASLRELLASGALPVRRALAIAARVAEGLTVAHEAGIVHRDLKPDNILVGRDGQVKIVDFGLAKLTEPLSTDGEEGTSRDPHLTQPGMVVGTASYMSPEQVAGASVGPASDQFALCLVLYEMLTGQPAFEREVAVKTMAAILSEEPPAVGDLCPGLPAPVLWFFERGLAKEPRDRWSATRDMARDLTTLSARGSDAPVSVRTGGMPRRPRTWKPSLGVMATAVVAAALGAALAAWLLPSRSPAPSFRSLTTSGSDSSPAVSPDGRLVAFTSRRDGTPRIWLKDLERGSETPLTGGPDDLPRISPDGARALFIRREGTYPALFKVELLGGEPRRLALDVVAADWSPDGRQVAYVKWDEDRRRSTIGLLDADGSNARPLLHRDGELVHDPRFSPDGRRIAFVCRAQSGVTGSVSVLDVGSGVVTSVVPPTSGAHLSAAVWSGDGRDLVFERADSESPFVVNTGLPAQVVLQPVSGGRGRALFWAPRFGLQLDVAGPGRLVLEERTVRGNLVEVPLAGGDATRRWLTRGQGTDRQPVCSPSGDAILFATNRNGNWDLWSLSTRSGAVTSVTDAPADDWDPAFVGAGERIVWSSNRTGHFEIWSARADGSEARAISHDGEDAENPAAAPDGSWIVYASSHREKAGLWKVRPDGSDAHRIVEGRAFLPEVSPDGVHVLYVSNVGEILPPIKVVRLSDGASVAFEIAPGEVRAPLRATGRAKWSRDGRSIVFMGRTASGDSCLVSQDFVPGQETTRTRRLLFVAEKGLQIDTFALAPEGSRVVATLVEELSSLVLADGFPDVTRPERRQR